jgi:hypothetical protein
LDAALGVEQTFAVANEVKDHGAPARIFKYAKL